MVACVVVAKTADHERSRPRIPAPPRRAPICVSPRSAMTTSKSEKVCASSRRSNRDSASWEPRDRITIEKKRRLPNVRARRERMRPTVGEMRSHEYDRSASRRAAQPSAVRRGGSPVRRATAAGNSRASATTKASRVVPMPRAPVGVVTIGRPAAMKSSILMFVPVSAEHRVDREIGGGEPSPFVRLGQRAGEVHVRNRRPVPQGVADAAAHREHHVGQRGRQLVHDEAAGFEVRPIMAGEEEGDGRRADTERRPRGRLDLT